LLATIRPQFWKHLHPDTGEMPESAEVTSAMSFGQ